MRFRLLCLVAPLLAGATLAGDTLWRPMPIVREAEYHRGYPGGEGMQLPYCTVRARSNPDRLYWAQDCGQVWRSDDGGRSWKRPACMGMYAIGGISIACDPRNEDVVLAIATNLWIYTDLACQGIYRSEDGGESWKRVCPVDYIMDHNSAVPNEQNRYTQHRFCWDPTTEGGPETARRWYCVVNREVNPRHAPQAGSNLDGRLYRSEDGGRTWRPVRDLDLKTYGRHDMLRHHPSAPGALFLGSEEGLFKSTDDGRTFTRNAAIPAGRVRTMEINPADPDDIYATVDDKGLYRTRDGGRTWDVVKEYRARGVAVHPRDRNVLYLYAAAPKRGATPGDAERSPLVSRDGGKTWTASIISTEGEFAPTVSIQYTRISGNRTVVLPDPRDTMAANVQSEMAFYRTIDGGKTFRLALQGITGMLANRIWFDPFNPQRFAAFNEDTGVQLTENGGRWFEYRRFAGIVDNTRDPAHVAPDKIPFSSVKAGDFMPVPESRVAVLSGGRGWDTRLIRTTDAGKTWKVVDTQLRHNLFIRFHRQDPSVVYADRQRSDDGGQTFAGIDKRVIGVFEGNSDIVYGVGPDGGDDRYVIYRSNDRGRSWHPFAKDADPRSFSPAAVFTPHPTNPDIIYTVARNGDPARYDAKSGNWTVFDILSRARREDAPRRETLHGIAVDPRNASTLYVLVQAIGSSVVFRSRDGGATWDDISYNLPRMGRFLEVHPLTGDVYFGCAGGGVYVLAQPGR